jgi:hypothetical protein
MGTTILFFIGFLPDPLGDIDCGDDQPSASSAHHNNRLTINQLTTDLQQQLSFKSHFVFVPKRRVPL